jgi:hypothetical protein
MNVTRTMREAAQALRALRGRAGKWDLGEDGFETIAPGLQATYRRGRNAMKILRCSSRPEDYHEWRKRVKDHWYHVRLLENIWPQEMQLRAGSLKDLETWLGDDHNLVVLRDKVEHDSEEYEEDEAQLCLALAHQHQGALRERALTLGAKLYEAKPKEWTRHMRKLWEAWQDEPEEPAAEQASPVAKKRRKPAQPAHSAASATAVA